MEGGAEYLATIFGTEKDRVNCPFYFKIGACRHGDKCERRHNKPTLSQTLVLTHMWANPMTAGTAPPEDKQQQLAYNEFYEDVFEEMSNFGEVEELNVCENLGDHLIGNVYVKFHNEDQASSALAKVQGRLYAGRPIYAEFSPVTDFREAVCKQFEQGECQRGGYCNFMHLRFPSRDLQRRLFRRPSRRSRSRSPRRRSRSPKRDRSRDRSRRDDRDRDRGDRDRRDRGGDRDRDHDRGDRGGGDRDRRDRGGDRERGDGSRDHDRDRERDRENRDRERGDERRREEPPRRDSPPRDVGAGGAAPPPAAAAPPQPDQPQQQWGSVEWICYY